VIDSFPKRHPETAFRVVDEDGGLVVLAGRSEVKVLNPVGIKVFSLLDGEHSIDAITAVVVDEFAVSQEDAGRDVQAFLDELQANGMLSAETPQETTG
jgi:hypothetical protein